ncbi:MAG: Asp-tRNA(Asn)/Glu-tRNA(Gln) amidotransferase subunit GatC [Acidobacteria bacterium]|nr:Asp-tRNA(Asn)/Glu-tRNA(Gln) amidotransferase subunit GatC [Acidobacteriota bacterium]MCI0722659.1 Asp-tRNA(Asn)/Glu-tRNA(Gln) amidotransferase subunit GatC [Acidobacteriota bacterium]
MKIGVKEVEYVGKLAQLAITEDEKKLFIGQLNSILEFVEQLNQLDTANVEPTAHAVYSVEQSRLLRPDEQVTTFTQDQSLANAPETGAGHFKVPKVIADR